MVEFSIRILLLSLLISAITAALVYLALHVLLVRPMRRMTANMVAFRADPENPARIIAASDRLDEIGTAERELAAMQLNIATMLQQKNHLAALGLAVSKINHDLRNLLRSEEHTSELQSRQYLVCRLLLEKKKKSQARRSSGANPTPHRTHDSYPHVLTNGVAQMYVTPIGWQAIV